MIGFCKKVAYCHTTPECRNEAELHIADPDRTQQSLDRWASRWRKPSSTSIRMAAARSQLRGFRRASARWACSRNFLKTRWTRCVPVDTLTRSGDSSLGLASHYDEEAFNFHRRGALGCTCLCLRVFVRSMLTVLVQYARVCAVTWCLSIQGSRVKSRATPLCRTTFSSLSPLIDWPPWASIVIVGFPACGDLLARTRSCPPPHHIT